jgi:radical SAM protein with 4Fe4S-binding SPASM domain
MPANKYSNSKIVWFNDKLISLRENYVTPPIYVRIKPINRCTHKCFFCVYNGDYSGMHENMSKKDILDRDKLFEILDDFKELDVKAITYSGGGEPLLYPNIIDTFKKTKDNGIDLSIITNGQLLNGDRMKELINAKWVRISMDYSDEKIFSKSRFVPEKIFFEIIENIRNFSILKNENCDLSVNYIITKLNCETIIESMAFLKTLGIDNVRISPLWNHDFIDYHKDIKNKVMADIEYARKKIQTEEFKIYDSYNITEEQLKRKYNKCYSMQIIPVIGADGNVYTCHNKAYDNEGIIGNVNDKSFKEMWFSEETHKFFNNFNAKNTCNHQCANNKKNSFIEDIINGYGDNFV